MGPPTLPTSPLAVACVALHAYVRSLAEAALGELGHLLGNGIRLAVSLVLVEFAAFDSSAALFGHIKRWRVEVSIVLELDAFAGEGKLNEEIGEKQRENDGELHRDERIARWYGYCALLTGMTLRDWLKCLL